MSTLSDGEPKIDCGNLLFNNTWPADNRIHLLQIYCTPHHHYALLDQIMSHSIISNFDWKLQWLDHEEEARIFTKSCCPPRLDEENQCLVPFDLKTRKYLVEQSVSAQGQNMARLKLFVTKYFLLCFTLLVNKRSAFTRMLFCRLSQYVDYYELILGEIYKGNTTILNEWWNIEATYQNCQHSWGRTKNTGGPLCDRKVITYSCIVWDLDNIMNADWSRLGFVTMDAKTFYLTEWIFDELERLHEDSWEDEQTGMSLGSIKIKIEC